MVSGGGPSLALVAALSACATLVVLANAALVSCAVKRAGRRKQRRQQERQLEDDKDVEKKSDVACLSSATVSTTSGGEGKHQMKPFLILVAVDILFSWWWWPGSWVLDLVVVGTVSYSWWWGSFSLVAWKQQLLCGYARHFLPSFSLLISLCVITVSVEYRPIRHNSTNYSSC
jgi:hypothetical protein